MDLKLIKKKKLKLAFKILYNINNIKYKPQHLKEVLEKI